MRKWHSNVAMSGILLIVIGFVSGAVMRDISIVVKSFAIGFSLFAIGLVVAASHLRREDPSVLEQRKKQRKADIAKLVHDCERQAVCYEVMGDPFKATLFDILARFGRWTISRE